MRFAINLLLVLSLAACNSAENTSASVMAMDSIKQTDTVKPASNALFVNHTETILPQSVINSERCDLVDFAETLVGIPYKYGCTDPSVGFDCSGFIYYVFNHFNITVPRSSVEYTNLGKEVSIENAKPGDLILFTGTDSTIRVVGHMGIVTENTDTLHFIHSSSGKIYSVTITPLNKYYLSRFIKIIDILPDDRSPIIADKTIVVNKVETISSRVVVTKIRKHRYHRLLHKHHHLLKRHHSSAIHRYSHKVRHHKK
jgi:cell wall-associated NlpC family hydrolase